MARRTRSKNDDSCEAQTQAVFQYGALDVPGLDNFSASYNETVSSAVTQVRAIYEAADARQHVNLLVSEGKHHEMDLDAVLQFLAT